MQIAEAFVRLRVRGDQAKNEAREQSRSIAQEATKMFAEYFTAKAVIGEFRKVINAASELEQAVGGTQAIFGQASNTIDRFARTSASAVGLSESAFRSLTSQIGGLLNGLGFTQTESAKTSIELTKLGADLAATFGGKPEEAVAALGAALRGEFNPLERFGVSLRVAQINLKAVEMGLAESKNEVSDHARAQAALALITEQTAEAQGQFARESDTAAGKTAIMTAKLEDARAKLGAELLPMFVWAVDLLTKMVDGFTELPGPIQVVIAALVGIAALASPVNRVVQALGGLRNVITKIGPRATAAAAAVALAYVAYNRLTASSRELERRTNEVADALINGVDQLHAYARQAAETETKVDDLAVAHRALSDALLQGDDGEKLTQALGALGVQADRAAGILLEMGDDAETALAKLARGAGLSAAEAKRLAEIVNSTDNNAKAASDAFAELGEEAAAVALALEEVQDQGEKVDLADVARQMLNAEVASSEFKAGLVAQAEELTGLSRSGEGAVEVWEKYGQLLAENADQLGDTADATGELADETDGVTRAYKQLEPATASVRQAQGRLRNEFESATDAADALGKAIDAVFGRYMDLDEATATVLDGVEELTESLEEHGATLDETTDAGRRNREQVRDQVKAIFDLSTSMLRSGSTVDEARRKVEQHTAALRDQLIQAGLTEEEVDEYLHTLGLTPENVTTAINLANREITQQRLEDWLESLDNVPDDVETYIQALIDEGSFATAEDRLNRLAAPKIVRYIPSAGGTPRDVRANPAASSLGRFVAGGTNLLTTVGEKPGRAGDEVILPLGNPSRIAALLADPRVSGPIMDAVGPMPVASGVNLGGLAVQVFIGERELEDIVDVRVDRHDRALAGALAAGRRF